MRKKLNFSSSSASDSPSDISPSATTVETTPGPAADATPLLLQKSLLPSPSEQKDKSDQVQEEFPVESVEVSLPRRSYSHATIGPEPSQIQFGPHNRLRPHWGRRTREA